MMKIYSILKAVDNIIPAPAVAAHCDIPCGIYDPYPAQIAAHSVIRMTQMILETKEPASPQERQKYVHAIARFTKVKEDHADAVKKEVRIIWGDYFKPEHIEKHPQLHATVWNIMKAASKARQSVDVKAAEELLEAVNKFAEIFWETKGVKTYRAKAPYPTEREMVYPDKRA